MSRARALCAWLSLTGCPGAESALFCRAETDSALCARQRASCGTLTADDNCGRSRTVECKPGCGEDQQCVDHACVCRPETYSALCARLGASCGELSALDNCGTPRTVRCDPGCPDGQQCVGHQCVCGAGADPCVCPSIHYSGDPVTEDDGLGRRDPSTDTLLNDAPWQDDNGTWRSCTQNTTDALAASCVSITGHQAHLLGATPDGSALLVHRAADTCGPSEVWLYQGRFDPPAYSGRELGALLSAGGFDLSEGLRLTLTPDGRTIIGCTVSGTLAAIDRSAPGVDVWSAPSDAWFVELNRGKRITGVAVSNDGLLLFFSVSGSPEEHWQAMRADARAPFTQPARLPGTAPGQINDGTYGGVTGAVAGGRTVYATRSFATVVLTRERLDDPLMPKNALEPLGIWYARPMADCRVLLGTITPGGCISEGIGTYLSLE